MPQLIILWNAREGWLDQAALVCSSRIWFQRLAPECTRAVALHLRTYTVGRLRSTERLETDAPGEVSGLLALSRETGFAAPCRTSRLEMNHETGQLLKPTSPPNSDQQALRLSMVVLRDEPRIYSAVAGRDRREACKRDQSPAGGRQNHACLCFQSSHQQPFCTC